MRTERKIHWVNKQIEKIESGESTHIRLFDLPLELIPIKVWTFKEITSVAIYNYRDKKLLSKIEEFKRINSLAIRGNTLSELKAFGNLKKIEALYVSEVSSNFILNGFDHLKSVSIHDSKIKTLPKVVLTSKNLEYLELKSLELERFTEDFLGLKSLKELILDSLKNFKKITPNFSNFSNLKSLKLDNLDITEIHKSVFNLKKLETLSITNQKIKVPNEIINLKNLSTLILTLNNTDIPEFIYNFTKLHTLILYGNQFKNIKADIKNLKNLTWLEIFNEGNPEQDLIISAELLKLPLEIIDIIGFSLDKNTTSIKELCISIKD